MSFKSLEREHKPLATSSVSLSRPPAPLAHAVSDSLGDYFRALNGHAPANLYDVILAQVEPPLLKATLAYCRGNQSKAADVPPRKAMRNSTRMKVRMRFPVTKRESQEPTPMAKPSFSAASPARSCCPCPP